MMKTKVLETIKRFEMISQGETVVVGVSGGADSVSLLHILCSIREDMKISVVAAHLNHMLRGEQADSDERFVKGLCGLYKVRCFSEKADCAALAKKAGEGIEECARRLRYDFFDRVARANNASHTATAHNANDNFETLLLNITRGSSLKGIGAIPPKRGNIIRPLIECSREEIEQYCRSNNLNFVLDSTNSCNIYSRNKVRNKVIPILTSINPNAVYAASRLCRLAREDEELLTKMSEALFEKARIREGEFDLVKLREAEKPIRARLFSAVIEKMTDKSPGNEHTINAVENVLSGKGKTQLQKNLFAELKEDRLVFSRGDKAEKLGEIQPESAEFCITTDLFRIKSTRYNGKINDLLMKNLIDYDTICGKLTLRGRKQGDKITLPKRNVTKTLKKLFNEERIDEKIRDLIPVLADEHGVVWVFGIGTDLKNAANEKSTNVIRVEGENIC
ncbi:MAG: tRNA(Ile)-lysidine synthase [Firmicutes bacterium ADurb.Bin300]|nr:MAG: tRNA(Ile)-lysidine synthase [Firmicutes bacterium ADurb.Bin300]